MEYKQEALSSAYFEVRAKRERIAKMQDEYSKKITELTEDEFVNIVQDLATAKALSEGGTLDDYIDGQEWYVNSLIEFSKLTIDEQLHQAYISKFGKNASVSDMKTELGSIVI